MSVSDIDILADTPETAPRADVTRAPVKTPRAVEVRKVRSSHAYKTVTEKFRRDCSQQRNSDGSRGAACWLCGQAINYLLKGPHPASFSVDHMIAANERPDLMLDVNNFKPSHFGCNSARGGMGEDIYGPGALGAPSEQW